MNKILVTGSNGFIGKHMTKALERAGYEVLAYDLDKTEEDLKQFVKETDFVVHLAGINRPLTTEEFYNGNTNFTKKLVDFLKISGKNTPILMSSSTQAALDNDYGKSKKMGEDYLFASGLPVYVFRLANVFGKWCRPNYNSAAATFMYNISHDLPIEVRDPNYVVHYNYVDDIVNTFIECIDYVIYIVVMDNIVWISNFYWKVMSDVVHKGRCSAVIIRSAPLSKDVREPKNINRKTR